MARVEKPRRCQECGSKDTRWTLSRERCDACIQNWECEADGGAALRAGEDFFRADGLEQVDRRLDREFDERSARDLAEVQRLDNVLLPAIKRFGARVEAVEFQIVSELALITWNAARRLGGQAEVQVWPAEKPRSGATRFPFGSVGAALAFRAEQHVFGFGAMVMADGEDADSDGQPHRKRKRRGDVLTDWERAQADFARAKLLGRPLPRSSKGEPTGGFLPIEFMPAKQSANGNHGYCRGVDVVIMALDIDRAVARAAHGDPPEHPGLTETDFGMLFDMRVGRPKRHIGERCWCGGRCFHGSDDFRKACLTWEERVTLRAAQVAEHVGASPKYVGDRVAHAEHELGKELHARDLVPKPRERREHRPGLARGAPLDPAPAIPIPGIEVA